MIKAPDAISAYQNAGKLSQGGVGGVGNIGNMDSKAPNQPGTFADLVKEGIQDTIAVTKASENMSAQFIAGNADIQDVVAAVGNAEITLNTVTAIRDRMVTALQEVMRMPI